MRLTIYIFLSVSFPAGRSSLHLLDTIDLNNNSLYANKDASKEISNEVRKKSIKVVEKVMDMSVSSKEDIKASTEKGELFSSLLESSAFALLLRRHLKSQEERSSSEDTSFRKEPRNSVTLDDNILQSLTLCLTMMNKESPEILHVAKDVHKFLKSLKHSMHDEVAESLFEGKFDSIDEIATLFAKNEEKGTKDPRTKVYKGGGQAPLA